MVDLDRLERVLIQAARERQPVTYGQLLAYFGWKVTRITVAALCRDLGRIEERRQGEGWPDLACLVVRRSDGLPGEGYFADLRRENRYAGPSIGEAAETFVRARQERAFRWAAGLGRDHPEPNAAGERAGDARSGEDDYRDEVMSAASRCM